MPPITKDTETAKSPLASGAENGTLLQMPATQRPAAEVGGRVQPVALEIPVSLNGARTVDGSDKREPFSETTKTVLVFGNGAVIRLTASVAPGQLLFLTNEKTKREVVCQVVKSKNYRNVSGYVELEFTESAVGFWGVRFPSDRVSPIREVPPAPAASTTPRVSPPAPVNLDVKREAPVSAPAANQAETSVGGSSLDSFPFAPPTAAPTPTKRGTDKPLDVPPPTQQEASKSLDEMLAEFAVKPQAPQQPTASQLKLENARLQEQLSSVLFANDQKTNVSGAPKPPNPLDQNPAEKGSNMPQDAAVLPRESKTQNPPQPPANIFSEAQPDEIEIPAWLMPKSNTSQLSNRSQESVAKSESLAMESPLAESLVEHSAPSGGSVDSSDLSVPNFGSGLTPGFNEDTQSASGSKKGLWIGVAAAVLILLGGGFWYLQQAGLLAGAVAANSPPIPPKAGNARSNTAVEAAPQSAPSSLASDAVSNPVKTEASAPSIVPPTQNVVATAATNNPSISTRDAQPPVSQPKKPSLGEMHLAAPVVHTKGASQDGVTAPTLSDSQNLPAAAALGANFSAAGGQPAAPSNPLPVGGNVQPAKLISSVQPVYTSIARSQHVSGEVKIDALIDADGRVTTMKIISGPTLLQQSAMDALRQWKYRPAMLNGSPVSMHLTVTLQFRLQ
jgi:protein TonB